ncbi:DNA topoisomerase VI subunit B [archaeon]|jgi:DNA topoisomerase VI subunit B|nr:DNA topoisomerase VI subunit B [archaeon]MBT6697756.1 DNA topoisomerase VI subunit B [archaeon]
MAKVHASELAKKQKQISVAEFFEKNRHLLGFDNPRRALLTTIKEAVDNSLDACEEARILPEISVEIIQLNEKRFRVIVEDNGPGIVKKQVPNIFARLLYGSKFHKRAQTRGQQGIGISASVLYGQLTTGKPAKVMTKVERGAKGYECRVKIDTLSNLPVVSDENEFEWDEKEHGTRIEIDLDGHYQKGRQSVDEYMKQTAIVNPHSTFIYTDPNANQLIFPRVAHVLPPEAKEIRPHPYGVELGILMKMMKLTSEKTVGKFLKNDFESVGPKTVKEICANSSLLPTMKVKAVSREHCEKLIKGIERTKIKAPPTDCISPITSELLEKGLRKEINAEFYCSVSRPAVVYRGNPFVIEAALAYGGEQLSDKTVRVMRFANRVPLLYQQGACSITSTIQKTAWKSYGLQQSRGGLPVGPCTIVVHMASTWVPFTSESKEALADYEEIATEVKRAMQDIGRKLASFVRKKKRLKDEGKKRDFITKFMPHVADALKDILDLSSLDKIKIEESLGEILESDRGELEVIKIDNPDYDPEFAKIGREEPEADGDKESEGSEPKETDTEKKKESGQQTL